MYKPLLSLWILCSLFGSLHGQPAWENLELDLRFLQNYSGLQASATYQLQASETDFTLTLLLDSILVLDSILYNGEQLISFKRQSDTISISLPAAVSSSVLQLFYKGIPRPAPMPPWDGGWVLRRDRKNRPWLTVACQKIGAKVWWPCPAEPCMKPAKTSIKASLPSGALVFVANGMPGRVETLPNGESQYQFTIHYPINHYNISFGVGAYGWMEDTLHYPSGDILPLHYALLDYDLDKAASYINPESKKMLRAYEPYVGQYPFPKDGFGIIQSPFAGMEHQSGIAYGNGFRHGYLGEDYSRLQLPFDFILIHEAGHEWMGNLISTGQKRDFWINEGFCTYLEKLFVQSQFGDSIAHLYLHQKKGDIKNRKPIFEGEDETGIDVYNKGALLVYLIELSYDGKGNWQQVLQDWIAYSAGKCVSTSEVVAFFADRHPQPASIKALCEQYGACTEIPLLQYNFFKRKGVWYVKFNIEAQTQELLIPVWLSINGKQIKLEASRKVQTLRLDKGKNSPVWRVERGYYHLKRVRP